MTRHWSRVIVSLGVVSVALASACGGDSSDTEQPSGGDAGRSDGAALGDDDSASPTIGDDAGGDATLGDDAPGSADDASNTGSAGDDAGDASSDGPGDAAGDEAGLPDAAGDGGNGGGGEGGVDAGAPADGGPGAGDGGGSTHGGDAGPDGAAPDAGPSNDGSTCNFAGTWGAEISMDVTWAAGGFFDIVIAPGSGTIKQWLLSTRTQSGTTVTDTAFVCGIQLPDFSGSALVNETYGIRFPDSLFDDGGLTSFSIGGTVSGSTPTATYTTTPTAVLLGLTLPNAATAVWPASITTEVDEDGDMKPGITATVVPPGGGFSYVPLDFLGRHRADGRRAGESPVPRDPAGDGGERAVQRLRPRGGLGDGSADHRSEQPDEQEVRDRFARDRVQRGRQRNRLLRQPDHVRRRESAGLRSVGDDVHVGSHRGGRELRDGPRHVPLTVATSRRGLWARTSGARAPAAGPHPLDEGGHHDDGGRQARDLAEHGERARRGRAPGSRARSSDE